MTNRSHVTCKQRNNLLRVHSPLKSNDNDTAGAGVLSLYDKLQEVLFSKVYADGKNSSIPSSGLIWFFS